MKEYSVYHLVKSEDLNHHGTLFAGRTAEWFVEASFVAAACAVGNPEYIVCVNIHGLEFKSPIHKGDVIHIKSKVVYVGKTSLIIHARIHSESDINVYPIDGFMTFVSVDLEGKKRPHGLTLDEPLDADEVAIREKAKNLLKK